MSAAAEAFYLHQAPAGGGYSLPDQLRGDAIDLMGGLTELRIADTSTESRQIVCSNLAVVLSSAHRYIRALTAPDAEHPAANATTNRLASYAGKTVLRALNPQRFVTGSFQRLFAEAIAPQEVPRTALTQITGHNGLSDQSDVSQQWPFLACFAVTGQLRNGSSTSRTAAIVALRAQPRPADLHKPASTPLISRSCHPVSEAKLLEIGGISSPIFTEPLPKTYYGPVSGGMRASAGGTTPRLPKNR